MTTRVRILGPLEVDGHPVQGPRLRAILTVLAMYPGEIVPAARLQVLVYGDAPIAATTLRSNISHLRRALRALQGDDALQILPQSGGWRLRVPPDQVDKTLFERLVAEGQRALDGGEPVRAAALLHAALDNYWRASPLADVEFGQAEQAALELRHATAVRLAAEADLASGRHTETVPMFQQLLDSQPDDSALRRLLCIALYRAGRVGDAVHTCREGIERSNEQGMDAPRLQELQRAILNQDPELDWRPDRPAHDQGRAARVAVSNLPQRNRTFVGRDVLLADVRRNLAGSEGGIVQVQAIHGLGGVGKTQLVIEYAHRYGGDYDVVWWVQAESPVMIADGLGALAAAMGLGGPARPEARIGELLAELGRRGRWLLIFDDVQRPEEVVRYWPPSGAGHVLVTSRFRLWRRWATPIEVDVFGRDEAVRFLRRRTGDENPDAANAVANALGDLPLALEQAGAYVEANSSSLEDYLDQLGEDATTPLTAAQPSREDAGTVATTWLVTLEQLREHAATAYDLLCLCAHLHPDGIPRRLLTAHADELPEPLGGTFRQRRDHDRAVEALTRYSLVAATPTTLRVHRLVQLVVREGLGPQGQRQWAAAAVRLVHAAFPREGEDIARWPECAPLVPHGQDACDHAERLGVECLLVAETLYRMARYLTARWPPAGTDQAPRGSPPIASEVGDLLRRALEIREAELGHDHPEVAAVVNILAIHVYFRGRFAEAASRFRQILEIRERQLGPDDPKVAESLSNLGIVLVDLGRAGEAKRCLERALAIRDPAGPDSRQVAETLTNLGMALRDLGELDRAVAELERGIRIWEGLVGAAHPSTAHAIYNLATVRHAQSRFDLAEERFKQSLRLREGMLGPNHPDVAESLDGLGRLLHDSGDLHQAATVLCRALEIRSRHLEPGHPHVAETRQRLEAVERELRARPLRPPEARGGAGIVRARRA